MHPLSLCICLTPLCTCFCLPSGGIQVRLCFSLYSTSMCLCNGFDSMIYRFNERRDNAIFCKT
ncbi:hypothetical protein O6H91_10G002700 [Diphasiastrum complanatum]|uniref:Uncharacterized protein n=1 Tax=Diphasiastrum complanatum TaxID=34168 RepID=A0ACC2CDR7_DIPCM|nr:hypothetical protein O6H91_10G002700 [Diphasiastrum complanatum]